MRRRLLFTVALAFGWAVTAGAATVELTAEELVEHSTLVIVGTVEEVISYPPNVNGIIYSDAKVRVRATVLGSTSDDAVTVRYLGGVYEGLLFGVSVEPTFRVGEEVVLFLAPGDSGVYKCPDGFQSKMTVVDGTVLPAGETLTAYLAEIAAAGG